MTIGVGKSRKKRTKAELERYIENVKRDYGDLWDKAEKYKAELEALRQKHDAFVLNFRGQTQRDSETIADLRKKVTAQEGRLMVAETAMQSMTIHIHLLTNQKGQDNA